MPLIYFAALEYRSRFDRACQASLSAIGRPPNVLISYRDFYRSGGKGKKVDRSPMLERFHEKQPGIKIIADSAAHSWKVGTIKDTDPEDFFQNYLQWCVNNRDLVHRFVELDLDGIVGEATVKAWRGEMLANGINPIYCWGPERGKEAWREACDDPTYDYLAIGGGMAAHPSWAPMIRRAHAAGKKVHGMGFTETKTLHRFGYYSVDSSTYMNGEKFGTLYVHEGSTLRGLTDPPEERASRWRRYAKRFEKYDVDFQKVLDGEWREFTVANILAWSLYAEHWHQRLARKHAPLRATDWPQWALAARAEVGTETLDSYGNRVQREVETLPLSDRDLARELEGYALDESTGSIVYRGPKLIAPTDADCYLQHTPEGTEVVMKKLPWLKSSGAPKPVVNGAPKKNNGEAQKKTIGETQRFVAGPPVSTTTSAPVNSAPKIGPRAEGRKEPIPVEPPPLPVMPDKSTAAIVNGAGKNETVENGAPNKDLVSPQPMEGGMPVVGGGGGGGAVGAAASGPGPHSLLETGERREAGPYEGQSGLTTAGAPGQEKGLGFEIRPVRGTVLTEVAPLRCRGCAKQGECPLFYDAEEQGLDLSDPQNDRVDLCRLDGFFAVELIKDRGGLEGARLEVINAQYQRLRRALAFEQMDGGMIDRQVSAELASFMESVSGILRETSSRGGPPVMAPAGNVSVLQILIQKHAPQPVIEVENTVRKYDPLG